MRIKALDDLVRNGDMSHLSEVLNSLKEMKAIKKKLDHEDIVTFFSVSLLPYYDAMFYGLNKNVGHIIYRISDFIEKKERENIEIYPSATGSLFLGGDDIECIGGIEGLTWASLEDWRKSWEKNNPSIPDLKMIPSDLDVSSLKDTILY